MIKELFLAIILGATLGFGATGAYFALNKSKTNPPKTVNTVQNVNADTLTPANDSNQSQKQLPSPTASLTATNQQLSIDSPQNESIVQNSKITLKGSSSPNSFIVIRTPVKSYQLTASDNGSFQKDIEVESGVNIITVSSFSSSDEQTDAEITITYSTAKI